MNADMKRLCEAAEGALEDAGLSDLAQRAEVSEAIVRTVLTALREPSDEALFAARLRLYRYKRSDEPDVTDTNPMAFAAMIDHVLAEPTTE